MKNNAFCYFLKFKNIIHNDLKTFATMCIIIDHTKFNFQSIMIIVVS